MYGYYQRACVLFTFSDSFLEQEFQNKTLILTKDHIQTFNEKPTVTLKYWRTKNFILPSIIQFDRVQAKSRIESQRKSL